MTWMADDDEFVVEPRQRLEALVLDGALDECDVNALTSMARATSRVLELDTRGATRGWAV